jgi:pimeloyl-ACP methyl ester carboxylesterase
VESLYKTLDSKHVAVVIYEAPVVILNEDIMSKEGIVPADLAEPPRPATIQTTYGPVEVDAWGEGPAVLALHGAMGGYDQSRILAETIAEPGYRFLALSRPGYLGTPMGSGVGPEAQADLMAALLDSLGLEDAALLAISGGGPSALHFALRHPGRCRALVLVSTCAAPMTGRIPLSFKIMQRLVRWPPLSRLIGAQAAKDPEKSARRSIPDDALRRRTLEHPEAGPLFKRLLASTADRMHLRMDGTEDDIRVSYSYDYPLEDISVPTLVVHGTQDSMLPYPVHGAALAALIPGAEHLAVEGGDHVAIFTHREQVRERVMAFLRR